MMRTLRLGSALALAVAVGTPAGAHHIWIAPDGEGVAIVHFGEFHENLKEVSPGLLDRVEVAARIVSANGEKVLEARRGKDGIALAGQAAPGESIIAEDTRSPVRERKTGEQVTRSIYHPGARLVSDLAARAPKLTLDIVPTGETARFQVFFRGAPLAKAKVEIIAASGWVREARTGQDGSFEASFPWKGLYAVEVSHADRTPGSRDGQPYDLTNFVTTLSFVQPSGLDPLPLPPPTKHNG